MANVFDFITEYDQATQIKGALQAARDNAAALFAAVRDEQVERLQAIDFAAIETMPVEQQFDIVRLQVAPLLTSNVLASKVYANWDAVSSLYAAITQRIEALAPDA